MIVFFACRWQALDISYIPIFSNHMSNHMKLNYVIGEKSSLYQFSSLQLHKQVFSSTLLVFLAFELDSHG